MDTEKLGKTRLEKLFIRLIALVMESRFRYKFFPPQKNLESAGIHPGMEVLEIGCGTGFFTITAGQMLGGHGSLIAMDMSSASVQMVSRKVQAANLSNVVRVVKGNALDTQLRDESLDEILLFGVIPAPMLPVSQLMKEMHRILRLNGILAVWPDSWVHRAIIRSGYFRYRNRRNGVRNYVRAEKNSTL